MLAKIVRLSVAATFLGVVGMAFVTTQAHAVVVPNAPTDIPIVDQTNTLNDSQKTALARKIADEREKSGNQVAIVLISTLENTPIETYSLEVSRQWGIGTAQNNNGVLLVIAKDDRQLRIEVGTGLEGALTDAQAGRIIRNDISPLFRQNKYYEGIDAGLTNIIAAINGEYTASATEVNGNTASDPSAWIMLIWFAFMFLSWLGSILARTKSWWAGGVIGLVAGGAVGLLAESLIFGLTGAAVLGVIGLILDKIVSANYQSHARRGDKPSWWAGGGFLGGGRSGGGSGGFGGFGGGGFGGGGASGRW